MNNKFVKLFTLISILLLLFALCACENDNEKSYDYDEKESTVSNIIETIGFDNTNNIPTEVQTTQYTYPIIEGKTLSAEFTHPEESYSYIYFATVTGRYRFDFDISNVNCNYSFSIIDEKEQVLTDKSYYDHGALVDLKEGRSYIITVRQKEGVDFEGYISIGVPLDIQVITSDFIVGEFRFESEIIQYEFSAIVSGIHRFDFDIDDTNKNYSFIVLQENESILVESSYNNRTNGCSVLLESGKTYRIQIIQNTGLASFKIKIYQPNSIAEIPGKTIFGTIGYIDQSDCFLFVAKTSGTYRFDFDTSDVTKNYNVKILNSKKTELGNKNYSNKGITVSLNKGEQYTIFVSYLDGFIDYTIKIGIPQEPENVSFPFSGTINYTNQNNIYYFSNVEQGNYIITFDINDVESKYWFKLYTSKNELIVDSNSSRGSANVYLNGNETYRIEISQAEGVCNYTIILSRDYSEN